MCRNGTPAQRFETDDERSYFLAILPDHLEVKSRGQVGGRTIEISLNDTEKEILEKGPFSTSELLEKLGLESRMGAFLEET